MKHPRKDKQLARDVEILGTKNGRNESIEEDKPERIRLEFSRRFAKRKTGNITSVIAFVYRLLLFKPFTDYCY